MARLLGRESVSSDVAALFELVKNAYDADATKVSIYFKNFSINANEKPSIVVIDNGDGMTYEEIDKNWMTIGTYAKEKNQRSKKGRRMVGNKGIGRFSTEKLATIMTVISKPRYNTEEIRLEIDWKKYEKEDVTFNDIENVAYVIPIRSEPKQYGTTVILRDLREEWTNVKINRLMTSISAITLPPELMSTTGDEFEVEISAPDFHIGTATKVNSLLFKNAPFKLTSILPDNSDECIVNIKKKGINVVEREIVKLKDRKLEYGGKWEKFGECKLTLYFYPGPSKYEKWDRYYRTALKNSTFKEMLDDIHGIKLYRDNFWVRPYGEKGNDWLNLEKARVMSNLKVGNTQVIGFVQITKDENPSIIDTTTRERVTENTAFESLKVFVQQSVEVLNKYRIKENKELREKQGKKDYQNILEQDVNYITELTDEIEKLSIEEKNTLKESVRNISKLFADYKEEKKQDYGELERSERTYRNLASLGISSASSYHEIYNIIAILTEIKKSILIAVSKDKIDKKNIENDLNEMNDYFIAIKQFLQFIRHFVRSLKNDYESSHEKEMIEVESIVRKLLEPFKGIIKSQNVCMDLRVSPNDLSIYMNRTDLYSVVVNLLTNSIKALNTLPADSEKNIRITIQKDAYNLNILFSNNGPAIDEKEKEEIFDILVSKYEEGTGLGLTITREIIEEYSGSIKVQSKPEFEPGASFEIKIPLEKLKK